MYRAAIIGCGFIGVKAPDNHLQAYLDCEDVELVAVCDKQPTITNRWVRYKDMVKHERLDIVSVCTPPETHREIVCDIAPYVKAIYCEKPIALTLEDADTMIETCARYNVILQVNHQRNFMRPKFRYSRGIINTGTHMFALIQHLFRDDIEVDIEAVDTEEPVFELDCTHNRDPMIIQGVKHLVSCLNDKKESVCSGEVAREALRRALEYSTQTV